MLPTSLISGYPDRYQQDHVKTISSTSVGVVDEGSVSPATDGVECGQDQPHCREITPLRKRSLSLPTVHLPTELQTALDTVVSSKFINKYQGPIDSTSTCRLYSIDS